MRYSFELRVVTNCYELLICLEFLPECISWFQPALCVQAWKSFVQTGPTRLQVGRSMYTKVAPNAVVTTPSCKGMPYKSYNTWNNFREMDWNQGRQAIFRMGRGGGGGVEDYTKRNDLLCGARGKICIIIMCMCIIGVISVLNSTVL